MIISGLTAANISSTVWAQAVRSLTNSGYETIVTAANQSLAIASQFNFQPPAGKVIWLTLGITQPAGGAGNATIELFDGTNVFVLATAAPGASAFVQSVLCTPSVFARINNQNNTNATKYAYGGTQDTV